MAYTTLNKMVTVFINNNDIKATSYKYGKYKGARLINEISFMTGLKNEY